MLAAGSRFTFNEFAIFCAASLSAIDHKIGLQASVGWLDDAAIRVLSKNTNYVRRPLFQTFYDVCEVTPALLLKPGEDFIAYARGRSF